MLVSPQSPRNIVLDAHPSLIRLTAVFYLTFPQSLSFTAAKFEAMWPQTAEPSLLDLDFDPLKPEPSSGSAVPAQSVPWDMWEPDKSTSGNVDQFGGDNAFVVDWSSQPTQPESAQPEPPAPAAKTEQEKKEPVAQPESTATENDTTAQPQSSLPAVVVETFSATVNGTLESSPPKKDMPPGFLYKVKAQHDYAATDNDELDLKSGEVVLVTTFDNPEEQDDGWLMGIKEDDWLQNKDFEQHKGVFPENFTEKYQ